jgi:hypothetical protein
VARWISLQLIHAYHQYGEGSRPLCKLQKGRSLHAAANDKDYQLLTHGRWFFSGNHFSYIMATSLSGGRSRITRKEPSTMGKQLVIFIICACESTAPFL